MFILGFEGMPRRYFDYPPAVPYEPCDLDGRVLVSGRRARHHLRQPDPVDLQRREGARRIPGAERRWNGRSPRRLRRKTSARYRSSRQGPYPYDEEADEVDALSSGNGTDRSPRERRWGCGFSSSRRSSFSAGCSSSIPSTATSMPRIFTGPPPKRTSSWERSTRSFCSRAATPSPLPSRPSSKGRTVRSSLLQLATILMGLAFLVIKYFEWSAKIALGLYPDSPVLLKLGKGEILFFGLYYVMTGLHGLHVLDRLRRHRLHDLLHASRGRSTGRIMPAWRTPVSTGILSISSGSTSTRFFI